MYVITNSRFHILGNEIHRIDPYNSRRVSTTRPLIYVFQDLDKCETFVDVMMSKKTDKIGTTNMTTHNKETHGVFEVRNKSFFKTKLKDKKITEYENYEISYVEHNIVLNINNLLNMQDLAMFLIDDYLICENNWLSLQGVIMNHNTDTNTEIFDTFKDYLDT